MSHLDDIRYNKYAEDIAIARTKPKKTLKKPL